MSTVEPEGTSEEVQADSTKNGWYRIGEVAGAVGVLLLFGLGVSLLIIGGVLLVFVVFPLYVVCTLLLNAVRYVVAVVHRLQHQIVGTAVVQKRLGGRILTAKQDVLRVGYELYRLEDTSSTDDSGANGANTPRDNTTFKFRQVIGYEENSAEGLYTFTLPGKESYNAVIKGYRDWKRGDQSIPSIPDIQRVVSGVVRGRETEEYDRPEAPYSLLWAVSAMDLLNRAERELGPDLESAYQAHLQAERRIIEGEWLLYRARRRQRPDSAADDPTPGDGQVDDDDPIRTHAKIVLRKSEQYGETAVEIVRELLCTETEGTGNPKKPELKNPLSFTALEKALVELNRYRMNEYRRLESLRITILGFVGVPALLLGILIVFFPWILVDTLSPVTSDLQAHSMTFPWGATVTVQPVQLFFILVLAFGAIGAGISGTQKIERDSGAMQSLEEILGYWLAFVRMVIGAISAFIVSIFLFSGLFEESLLSLALILGISVAAGFSERLALRAISSFETRAMPQSSRQEREDVV